jgi:hypothetical protein
MRDIPATEDGRPPAGPGSRSPFRVASSFAIQFDNFEHTRPVRRQALRIVCMVNDLLDMEHYGDQEWSPSRVAVNGRAVIPDRRVVA